MKVKILTRCETSDEILLDVDSREDAESKAAAFEAEGHVLGCRVIACAGGKAFVSHVAKYQRGREYDVPAEVGESLVEIGYAEAV